MQSIVQKSTCSLQVIRGRLKEFWILPRGVLRNAYSAIPHKNVNNLWQVPHITQCHGKDIHSHLHTSLPNSTMSCILQVVIYHAFCKVEYYAKSQDSARSDKVVYMYLLHMTVQSNHEHNCRYLELNRYLHSGRLVCTQLYNNNTILSSICWTDLMP